MSTPRPVPNDSIAKLVRATLEADANGVDAARMQSQIREKLAEEGHTIAPLSPSAARPTMARPRAIPASLVAATLLVLAGLAGYFFVSTSPVQAYALVQSAHRALQTSADREYRVNFNDDNQMPFLNAVDEVRLWTRGDRYRVIFRRGDKSILWGQDEKRRIWVVTSAHKGLSFEPEEIPSELAAFLAYLSLDINRIADQILQNCDLSFNEQMHRQRDGTKTVHATPRHDRGQVEFSTADLEIDETTKVIQSLQLTRRVNGTDQGRFQFTLLGNQPQTDESYRLRTQLKPGDQVLTKAKYYDRMVELFRAISEFTEN